MRIETNSPEETERLGQKLGERLLPGDVLALVGPLGSGKTQLTRGLARGVGSNVLVTSPTFKLVNEYAGRIVLYHIDAYRLRGAEDLIALGCEELFDGDGAAAVEWADRVAAALPARHLLIEIDTLGPTTRRLTLTPTSSSLRHLMDGLA